jgi:LuxR family maltose regulon positive regulatory protein
LDEEVIRRHPFLCAGLGWAHVLTGQVDQALAWVAAGEAAPATGEDIVSLPDNRRIGRAEVSGHLHAVRAYAARIQQDGDGVAYHSRAALADLPADADTVRCTLALNWGLLEMEQGHEEEALAAFAEAHRSGSRQAANLFVALSALGLQGDLHVRAGRLTLAEQLYNQVIEEGERSGEQAPPAVGVGYLGLAQVHLWRGEFARARRRLEEGMQRGEQLAFSEALDEALMLQARIALGEGQYADAAGRLAAAAVRMEQADRRSRLYRTWALLRAAVALAQGDLPTARAWAANQAAGEHAPLPASTAGQIFQQELLLRSRILLADGAPRAALELQAGIEAHAALPLQCERAVLTAQCHLLEASRARGARDQAQAHEQALSALTEAVALAAPERLRLPFLNAQPPLTELLRKLAGQTPHAAFAASLLPRAGAGTAGSTSLAEPLSEREEEVLRLLAAGLTNAEIAATLIVAPSTVKTHVNRVLGKLAAANRTQAVAHARELGILPS